MNHVLLKLIFWSEEAVGKELRKNNLKSQAKMSIFLSLNWGYSEGELHSMAMSLEKYRLIFIHRITV